MAECLLTYILSIFLIYNSVSADLIFHCDFENSNCGFTNDPSLQDKWIRFNGPTPSTNSGPETDHTLGNAEGKYMYAEATGTEFGAEARMSTSLIEKTGGTCTRITFWYHMRGDNTGDLNLYLLGQPPYYFVNPVWQRTGANKDDWQTDDIYVAMSVNYSIAFETVFDRSGVLDKNGDVAIDDITVDTIACTHTSCDDLQISCLNGGTCIQLSSGSEPFRFKCECTDGFSGYHCENDFDECASAPCKNNGICTHGLNELNCKCQMGFYGDKCEYIDGCVDDDLNRCQNGGTCTRVENDFYCTCLPGYTGKVCETNIDDCALKPCVNGGQCVDGVDSYTCDCPAEYYGYNCQSLAGSCDFDDGDLRHCGYTSLQYPYSRLDWIVNRGRTPIPTTGPPQDHTSGSGYYTYAEVDNPEEDEAYRTARLMTPILPQASVGKCTNVTFWYYMDGDDVGTLNLYTMSESNTIVELPFWTMTGKQDNSWRFASVLISSTVPYSLVFDAVSKQTVLFVTPNFIGLDDVLVDPDSCVYQHCLNRPCQNGGICYEDGNSYRCECVGTWGGTDCTDDRDECSEGNPCLNGGTCTNADPGYICKCLADYAGYSCEYLKGSCDFDDPHSPLCDYVNDITADFAWTRNKGPTPSDLTGPSVDHTLGTSEGYYLYVEATDRKGGDRARIITPKVPDSGSKCTGLDFWYHIFGSDIGELAVYVKFGEEDLTIPIWNVIGSRNVTENSWKPVQLNISSPNNFKLVFEATVLPQSIVEVENRGDIAIDDIVVHYDRTCSYDKCFISPCQNGGICITIDNDYRCDCKSGYDGKDCDNVPACTPNPCKNGGTCVLGSDGSEECLCLQGWMGDDCDTADYCYPNQCEHGGTCTSYESVFDCECPPGYMGKTCEIDINECESSPCRNGATCTDLPNAWRCDCERSYIGQQCNMIEGGCDFQNDLCEWTSESSQYEWDRYSGPSPNWPTSGPRNDYTYQNESGFYLYTPVYSDAPDADTRYRLRSPTFPRGVIETGKILTLQFFHHMSGPGIGTLNVYFSDSTGEQEIGSVIPDGRDQWQQFTRTVEPLSDFSFVIEHQIAQSALFLADMAIDEISLIVESGLSSPSTTTPLTTTSPTTTPPETTKVVETTTTSTTTPKLIQTTASGTDSTTKDVFTAPQPTASTDKTLTTKCPNCVSDPDDDGLSGGAIAGIVIGVLAGVALAGVGILYYRKKEYGSIDKSSHGVDNRVYGGDENL